MPYVETPPPDLSGGYMVFQYSDGTHIHRQRVHVPTFNSAVIPFPYNYPYAPALGGLEVGIGDTAADYMAKAGVFYAASFTITLVGLFQNVGGVITEIFPLPVVAPFVCLVPSNPAGWLPENFYQLNMRTAGGHKVKFIFLSPAILLTTGPTINPADTASDVDKFVLYVTTATNGIRAHDGTMPLSPSHTTYGENRRLRRHYGHA